MAGNIGLAVRTVSCPLRISGIRGLHIPKRVIERVIRHHLQPGGVKQLHRVLEGIANTQFRVMGKFGLGWKENDIRISGITEGVAVKVGRTSFDG
jgi:hypothetical protein